MRQKILRIALLTNVLEPFSSISGIGRQYADLADGLARLGHQVTVIGVGVTASYETSASWGTLISIPKPATKRRFLPQSWQNAILISREMFNRKKSFDVIESTSFPGLTAFLLPTNVPVVIRLITSVLADTNTPLTMTIPQFILEWLSVRRASLLIAASSYIIKKARILYRIAENKPDLVPLGVADVARDAPDGSTELVSFIVIAGAMHRKGTDVLLKAIERVLESTSNFELTLVGPKYAIYDDFVTLSEDLTRSWTIIQRKMQNRLRVMTEVPQSEKLSILERSDYLIMPSRSESFGIPIIEAMRAATPIISSAGGALLEIVSLSSANFVYDNPEDSEALAEFVLLGISEGRTDARERGRLVRKVYEDRFTTEIYAANTERSYYRALELKHGA